MNINHGSPVARVWHALSGFGYDLRITIRVLRRNPRFALGAALILGSGIGLNTAMFSVVRATIFREVPVNQPEELVYIYGARGSRVDLVTIREVAGEVMAGTTSHVRTLAVMGDGDQTRRLGGDLVSGNYFALLGIEMAMGRALQAEDDDPSNPTAAVVLSHDYWTRHYQGDPTTLGRRIQLDGRSYLVVGIAPVGFGGLSEPWNPANFWTTSMHFYGRASHGSTTYVIGRLRPGVTLGQATKYFGQLQAGTGPGGAVPQPYMLRSVEEVITPFEPDATGALRLIASTAMIIIGAVLLIAAINITGSLMARAITRTRELAIRTALGASGFILLRQLLQETLLITLLGGCIGIGVATVLVHVYETVTPDRLRLDLSVDMTVLAFVLGLCLLVAIIVGIAPALQARKINIVEVIGGGQGAGVPRSKLRGMRLGVVLPQVVLSVALLIVAGVHARAMAKVELTDLGYRSDGVVVLTISQEDVDRPGSREVLSEQARAFFRQTLRRAREDSPRASIALLSLLPSSAPASPLRAIARESPDAEAPRVAGTALGYVSDGLFVALDIPLLAGRDFEPSDQANRPAVAIISASLAQQLWNSRSPVGQYLALYSTAASTREWLEVIGVVGDIRPVLPDGRERPFLYRPIEQIARPGPYPLAMVAYGPYSQAALVQKLRNATTSTALEAQVWNTQSMKDIINEALYLHRVAAWMLGLSGVAGLILASIGTYGVVSHGVAQRLPDIAIRATLGATPNQIIRMTVMEAAVLAGMAMVPGVLLAHSGLQITARFLGSLPILDYPVFIVAPLTMAAVVIAAAYLPARRAAQSAPLETLRRL